MDMNNFVYTNNMFDVYFSSAVIKYSPDIHRTVTEAIRVTRNGGIVAFGFMYGMDSDIIPEGSHLEGGVSDLLTLFKEHVDHVYWHDEYVVAKDDIRAAVIFRLRKKHLDSRE
jgi:ubiquinone/menaquinone biosynthesis C-methylase UbiE